MQQLQEQQRFVRLDGQHHDGSSDGRLDLRAQIDVPAAEGREVGKRWLHRARDGEQTRRELCTFIV